MALVRQNIVMQGLSGTLGEQLVIKVAKGGRTIVSVKPTFDENRAFSTAASLPGGCCLCQGTEVQPVYIAMAEGSSKNAYNVAMADWFHAPEILEIDLEGWSGEAGQVLRIRAQDDVQVQHVAVVITDETDTLLEQGSAEDVGAFWWEDTTTGAASGNPKVMVAALDISGHMTQVTEQKALDG